ncbi:MAG: hypothetical protein IPK53_07470 [bacterium]|nr:hypothetical protein [bacterium]
MAAEIPAEVTAVLVAQLQGDTTPEIIVGTVAGHIYIYARRANCCGRPLSMTRSTSFVHATAPSACAELLVVSQNSSTACGTGKTT